MKLKIKQLDNKSSPRYANRIQKWFNVMDGTSVRTNENKNYEMVKLKCLTSQR